jgi:hypothetical protein
MKNFAFEKQKDQSEEEKKNEPELAEKLFCRPRHFLQQQ